MEHKKEIYGTLLVSLVIAFVAVIGILVLQYHSKELRHQIEAKKITLEQNMSENSASDYPFVQTETETETESVASTVQTSKETVLANAIQEHNTTAAQSDKKPSTHTPAKQSKPEKTHKQPASTQKSTKASTTSSVETTTKASTTCTQTTTERQMSGIVVVDLKKKVIHGANCPCVEDIDLDFKTQIPAEEAQRRIREEKYKVCKKCKGCMQ